MFKSKLLVSSSPVALKDTSQPYKGKTSFFSVQGKILLLFGYKEIETCKVCKRESVNLVRSTGTARAVFCLSVDVAQCSKDRISTRFKLRFFRMVI